jgi:hypothetical protein
MLLIPLVALKLGSTGWRFLRYYAGSRLYRLKGQPQLLLRLLIAPAVVVSTLVLFGTGVALLVVGLGGGIVLGLHKASFVLWLGTMTVHVLAYAFKLPALAVADWRTHHTAALGVASPRHRRRRPDRRRRPCRRHPPPRAALA